MMIQLHKRNWINLYRDIKMDNYFMIFKVKIYQVKQMKMVFN